MLHLERVLGGHLWTSVILASVLALTGCAADSSKLRLPDDPAVEPVILPPESDPLKAQPEPPPVVNPSVDEPAERERVLARYRHLDPLHLVPMNLLEEAVLFYDANLERIKNRKVLSVIDFSRVSSERRFFIINIETGAVWSIAVAHGKGSDAEHDGIAEKFSNRPGSNASSLGFYLAAETYKGSNGLSLRLDGLSVTNSNARRRAIVIHGASYVKDLDVIQGRSWGCPAVASANRDKVIGQLKQGSLLYIGLSLR